MGAEVVSAKGRKRDAYMPREAIARMFDEAPCEWWRFVPCGVCNATRQHECQTVDGLRKRPHVSRRRSGLLLHGTLWLLANFPSDVLDPPNPYRIEGGKP
jgi:hypothetical protein